MGMEIDQVQTALRRAGIRDAVIEHLPDLVSGHYMWVWETGERRGIVVKDHKAIRIKEYNFQTHAWVII